MDIWNIIEFNSIDSTNKYIKDNLDKLSVFDVITANQQTSGYGRLNRSWYDNNDNLSFSCLLKFPASERLGLLTQIAAASVTKALETFGIEAKIKWPNDVLVNQKKICGILVENVLEGDVANLVLGIGVNVNNQAFSDEIANKATSMYLELDKTFNKTDVMKKILEYLEIYLSEFSRQEDSFMKVVREKSILIGKSVELFEGDVVRVLQIDDLGRLVVQKNDETLTYMGSEVSLTNIYNS